jgi:class 3 adenylate cyclase
MSDASSATYTDGVMLYLPEPAQAVVTGLELVQRIPDQGLPCARIGINSGPVVFQHGDDFGRTVNVAARITDHARPGEVLVSDSVVTATSGPRGGALPADRPDHPQRRADPGQRRNRVAPCAQPWCDGGVEVRGFEPLASSVRGRRSAGLSYTPR